MLTDLARLLTQEYSRQRSGRFTRGKWQVQNNAAGLLAKQFLGRRTMPEWSTHQAGMSANHD